MPDHEVLDEETSEQLLAGRYRGAELAELSALLADIRATAGGPVPAPSPALARLLREGLDVGPTSAPVGVDPRGQLPHAQVGAGAGSASPSRGRRLLDRPVLRRVAEAALLVGAAATGLTGAAAADILPAPVTRAVGTVLHAVTPLHLPDERGVTAAPAVRGDDGRPGPGVAGGPGGGGDEGSGSPAPGGGGSSVPGPTAGKPTSPGRGSPTPPQSVAPGADHAPPGNDKRQGGPGASSGDHPGSTSVRLVATLTPGEVPGRGDPGGGGTVVIEIDQARKQLCFSLVVTGLQQVTDVHLHRAPLGATGPVVATLSSPVNGGSSGCVVAGTDVLAKIGKRPSDYFVDVHTDRFPAGALRGQLVAP